MPSRGDLRGLFYELIFYSNLNVFRCASIEQNLFIILLRLFTTSESVYILLTSIFFRILK